MAEIISVSAPRKHPWVANVPGSVGVLDEEHPDHPANPAYSTEAGHVVIDEGCGIPGDPGWKGSPKGNPAVKVAVTPAVNRLLASGQLVRVGAATESTPAKPDAAAAKAEKAAAEAKTKTDAAAAKAAADAEAARVAAARNPNH